MNHRALRHAPLLLRLGAGLILLYLAVIWAQAGAMKVENVRLTHHYSGQSAIAQLPLNIDTERDWQTFNFRFVMPWHWWHAAHQFTLRFKGCIKTLQMGDKVLKLEDLRPNMRCNSEFQSYLFHDEVKDNMYVSITLYAEPEKRQVLLEVERHYPIDFHTRMILLLTALYAIGLSMVRSREEWMRYTGVALTLLIFFVSYTGTTSAYIHGVIYWRGQWSVRYHDIGRWQTLYFERQYILIGIALLACLWVWKPRLRPWHKAAALLKKAGGWRPRPYLGALFVAFVAATVTLGYFLFHWLPQIPDSTSQYVQGKIFASGKLWLPGRDMHEFFDYRFIRLQEGRVFSMYVPGHSALMAIGQLLHAPWLVNPVLGGLTLILIYLLARELGGRGVGYAAAALALISPFLLFMSSEFMSHVSCLFFITLMVFAYIRQHRTLDRRFALLAGFGAGYALFIRPQTLLALGLPLLLHALYSLAREPKRYLPNTLCMAAAALPFLGITLWWNYATMADPLTFSQEGMVAFKTHVTELKFLAEDKFWSFMAIAFDEFAALHQHLFGWPATSLVFVFLLFLLRGARPYAKLVLACALSLGVSLLLIPIEDGIFGPRYLYEASGILIALTALGMAKLPVLLRARLGIRNRLSVTRGMVACYAVLASLVAIPTHVMPYYKIYEHEFWAGGDQYYQYLKNNVQTPALVFLAPYNRWWRLGFSLPPEQDAPIVLSRDLGKWRDRKLMEKFPGRRVYYVQGWDITRGEMSR